MESERLRLCAAFDVESLNNDDAGRLAYAGVSLAGR
jgi:hypothetical protein